MLHLFFIFPLISVGATIWFYYVFVGKIKSVKEQKYQDSANSLAMVIVVKNEENRLANLLAALVRQTVQSNQLIFVDDHSSDGTVQLLQKWTEEHFGEVILNEGHGKKNGLLQGVQHASAQWILTTDADCIPNDRWVEHASILCSNRNKKFWILPVRFNSSTSIISKMDALEAYSLIGSTFGVTPKQAFMCNGANLLFFRANYLDYRVFDENIQLPTGDDLFALFAFKRDKVDSIGFSIHPNSWVSTNASNRVSEFWKQRKRWASKARMYTDVWAIRFSWVVFLSALSSILLLLFLVIGQVSWHIFMGVFGFKAAIEYSFLKRVTAYFQDRQAIKLFVPVFVLYNFYVLIVAIFGLLHSFKPSREVNGAV